MVKDWYKKFYLQILNKRWKINIMKIKKNKYLRKIFNILLIIYSKKYRKIMLSKLVVKLKILNWLKIFTCFSNNLYK